MPSSFPRREPTAVQCGGSARDVQRAYVIERSAESVLLYFKVVAGLQVHPEPLRGAEVAGEPKRGVGGDTALALRGLVCSALLEPPVLCPMGLALCERPR